MTHATRSTHSGPTLIQAERGTVIRRPSFQNAPCAPGAAFDQADEPWREGEETWRVLRAFLPGRMASHSPMQKFYFGSDYLLRRHDYNVDIAGSFAAAQLTTDYVEANAIKLPTQRRAYAMGPDRRPIPELLMVAIHCGVVASAQLVRKCDHQCGHFAALAESAIAHHFVYPCFLRIQIYLGVDIRCLQ